MNPDPSVKSANQATIPVPLQQALSSLDVSLETELARYRRLRPRSPRPRPQVEAQRLQPLELFEAGRTPTVAVTEETPAQTVPPLNMAEVRETPTVSSLVHLPTPSATEVDKPPTPAPQEYLQSSEELLRSLKTDSSKEKTTTNRFFTPLGIGSILVFLVSSALLGSALVDGEGFKGLKLDQWTRGTSTSSSTEEGDIPQVAPINAPDGTIPQSPNLARQEFIDLDLGSLSTLPVDEENAESMTPAPTPAQTTQPQTTPGTPEAPTAGSNLTTALLPPALRPQPVTPEGSTSETPASETASEDVEAAPAPTNSNFYFVMADYTGANSLAKAREIVSDAYLVELSDGVHIQMGASPQESSAQALAKQLQDQGFVTSIYRP